MFWTVDKGITYRMLTGVPCWEIDCILLWRHEGEHESLQGSVAGAQG